MSSATPYRVEYLLTSNVSDSICSSLDGFSNLLRTVEGLEINGSRLTYKSSTFAFETLMGNLHNGERIYFDVTITSNNEADIDILIELNRKIRTVATKLTSSPIQTLWDDISHYYSLKAYPHINEIENLMRKLITKFMIVNTGLGWHEKSVPKEVEQSVRLQQKSNDYLHDVDFIQLSNFLFKEYASSNDRALLSDIKKAKNIEDLDLDELKAMVPKSNWERYFSPLIACDADFLRIRWEKIYDLRCKVAHNKSFSKGDFSSLINAIEEIKPHITKSIEKLTEIEISDESKEEVAETAISNTKGNSSEFIEEWHALITVLYKSLLTMCDASEHDQLYKQRNNFRYILNRCQENDLIDNKTRSYLKDLIYIRNAMVHSTGIYIEDKETEKMIQNMQNIRKYANERATEAALQNITAELFKNLEENLGKATKYYTDKEGNL